MKKESYLSLLIFCALWSQGLAVISNDNIDKSSDLLIRKKRVINHLPGGVQPAHVTTSRHIVQIQVHDEYECVGTILEANTILTVRNCLYGTNDMYSVLSGSLIKNNGTRHRVVDTVKYLNYNIALLKIYPPIRLSANGNQKINLFRGSLPTSGLFSGWGCTNISSNGQRTYPQHLMATLLPIINVYACREAIRTSHGRILHLIPADAIICTLDPHKERGACYGDEGGPLVYSNRLLGIYSHNEGVNLGVHPDVFVGLTLPIIYQWINRTTFQFQNTRPA